VKMRAPGVAVFAPDDFVLDVRWGDRQPAQCATFAGSPAGRCFTETLPLWNSQIVGILAVILVVSHVSIIGQALHAQVSSVEIQAAFRQVLLGTL
jgi:hypothetical protein